MNTVTSSAPTRQPFGRTPGIRAMPAAFRQCGRELRQVGTLAAWFVVILRPNREPGVRALRRAAIGISSLR
jgi:hypothetical protein